MLMRLFHKVQKGQNMKKRHLKNRIKIIILCVICAGSFIFFKFSGRIYPMMQISDKMQFGNDPFEQRNIKSKKDIICLFKEKVKNFITEKSEIVLSENVSSMEEQKYQNISVLQSMSAGEVIEVSNLNQEIVGELFYSTALSQVVKERIWNNSYKENNDISIEELCYLRVLHMGFDGQTHIGELIVNQTIAEEVLEIMLKLYQQSYPIEKMILIDEYGADDEQSMADNNTSAFNYRKIAGTDRLSNHSLGFAIDINPKYNPYVKQQDNGELIVSPLNSTEYIDRNQEFPYKIDENDLCCQLFLEYGFTWGGNWNSVKDYQHFEKSK